MRMLLHHTTANAQVSWLVGVWIGKDAAANKAQIKLLGKLLAEFPSANLAGIAVGNEAISRGDVTEQQLLQYIAQVREVVRATAQQARSHRLAAVPVLTVELPAAVSPELVAAVDGVGAVLQPFFTGAVDTTHKSWAESAVAVAVQQYRQLQGEAQGKRW
ncbi:hypothetical protein COO60DRAFT_556818 [Scenedesmus sp. NREL 46B-D3]|nr:hypothetical protein COO60DRAFT_556818 [Scenedesmus sp. NREL 46B-D3]